jgi:plastocyanin
MNDHQFTPAVVTIRAGDSVVWVNRSGAPHTATADDGSFDTGNVRPGASATVKFNKPGTYPYYCIYHGARGGVGMSGKVIVMPAG